MVKQGDYLEGVYDYGCGIVGNEHCLRGGILDETELVRKRIRTDRRVYRS